MSPSTLDLAGRLRLAPGQPLPNLSSTRRDWAPRLSAGCTAQELPGRLATLFTLCAQAHRLTAERAVQTALGDAPRPAPQSAFAGNDAQRLRLATARDQVLRIAHDWVRLGTGATARDDALLPLRACPLWREDLSLEDRLAALPEWLAHRWLGEPATEWLARIEADPVQAPIAWAAQGPSATARLLHALAPRLTGIAPALQRLAPPDTPDSPLPELAVALRTLPGFALQPTWRGAPAETGPWTRRHDPLRAAGFEAGDAWQRLFSRLIDVVRLALPGGEHWLDRGSLSLGDGEALAWTEMARGLLIHRVRLAPQEGVPQVAECQVLAPTEWNFHPQGAVAQALAALPAHRQAGDESGRTALGVVAAFDPCVEVDLLTPEAFHA